MASGGKYLPREIMIGGLNLIDSRLGNNVKMKKINEVIPNSINPTEINDSTLFPLQLFVRHEFFDDAIRDPPPFFIV